MLRIAHIVNDEKFIDTAIEIFNQIKDSIHSTFYCYTKYPLKYIFNKEDIQIFNNENAIIEEINKSEACIILLHSRFLSYNVLSKIDKKKKLIWISWGYDLYNQTPYLFINPAPINFNIYKPLTRSYLRKEFSLKYLIKYFFKLQFIRDKINKNKFYNRVDYLSTILPVELEYANLFLRKYNIKKFYFSYMRQNVTIPVVSNINVSNKENILLGNSAAETNNHVDVLKVISKLNINHRKIIIPLSYCGNNNYINYLESKVKEFKLENNVIYLKAFIPYADYTKILDSVGYAFFGHIRQQAIGNINILLRNGCKIFLYKDSLTYKQYTKDGYKIYTIEDIKNDSFIHLSQSDIEENLSLAQAKGNYDKYISSLKDDIIKIASNLCQK